MLDINAIEAAKTQLDKRGNGDLLKVSDLPDKGELDIRILPPTPSLGNLFYLKTVDLKLGEKGGWAKSLLTFGNNDCPVMKIWNEAKQSSDKEVAARAKAIKESPSYFIPVLHLTKLDNKGNVLESKPTILAAKATIVSLISGYFADGKFNNGKDDLLADREEGLNFTIKRTGTGQFDTKYTLQPFPRATSFMDEKYDEVYNAVPDAAEVYKAMMGDISGEVDKITSYLYGKATTRDVEDK